MNPTFEHELAWSPRRWFLLFFLVLAIQFGFLFWFSTARMPAPPRVRPRTHVQFCLKLGAQSNLQRLDRRDPALFALVTTEGFSGEAWLTAPHFPYAPAHPPEPLHWLPLSADELADDFAEFVQTNVESEDLIVDRLPPALAQPVLPVPILVTATVLMIEGELAGRAWDRNRPLPRAPEPILTNTVVRILVNASGAPISAAVLSSSGTAKADQDALNFARAMRFVSATDSVAAGAAVRGGLAAGNLVFQWTRMNWEPPVTRTAQR